MPASSSPTLIPVDASALPQLSAFLTERFRPGPDDNFGAIEYLRWQYLDWPQGPGERAYNFVADDGILAHVATVYTRFLLPGKVPSQCPVASNIHSWASTPRAGPSGAMLLFQSFEKSEVQFAFSFSPKAEAIFKATSYTLRQVIPMFRRLRKPLAWNRAYPGSPLSKRLAFLSQETALRCGRIFMPAVSSLELQPVTKFDDQAEAIAAAAARNCLLTERSPAFLTHLLGHPFGETLGYYFRDAGRIVGLALLHLCQRNGLRQAKILDCLVEPAESQLCSRALAALEQVFEAHRIDLAFGMAGTPWLETGFRRAGYVRRGRRALLIRDPNQLLPSTIPVHMAYLDSDLAFIG